MQEEMRTIGFVCPDCRQSVIVDRTVFSLTAAPTEIRCPCGKSQVRVEYFGDHFQIGAPCTACKEGHVVTCPADAFLRKKALAFSCNRTGLDCCYVGEEDAVYAAMRRLEQAEEQLHANSEKEGTFLNDLVMEEFLSELKDIAARDGISCTCGCRGWKLRVHYSSVEVECARCGAVLRMNAATMDDLNDLCCKQTLTIRGR